MVNQKSGLPPKSEVEPDDSMALLVRTLAEQGEAIADLVNGDIAEFHGHDTHVFPSKGEQGMIFHITDDEDEEWVPVEQIVRVRRH